MSHTADALAVGTMALPTAGFIGDFIGSVRVAPPTAGDAVQFIALVGNGANSAQTGFYTGDRDPNGLVSALPGTLYLRQSGVNSNLYQNISVGPGAGTSWALVASLGAVPTWAAVLGAGNLSGGTDAVMSNTDELQWVDGAAVVRRSDDLVAGEPRTRFFTAAAALASTLSVATATGVLSYTDDLTLNSASPVETLGNDTGAPVQVMRKSGASQAEIDWNSGGATVFQDGFDASESRWIARSGVNFALTMLALTQQTELNDATLWFSNDNPLLLAGTGLGFVVYRTNKADAQEAFGDWTNAAVRRWLFPYFQSNENLASYRYDAAGVFVNVVWEHASGATTSTYGDSVITMTSPSVVLALGPATGTPRLQLEGAAASANWIRNRQGGTTTWDSTQTHNDANFYWDRFVAGVFQDSAYIDNAGGHWHLPNNLYLNDPNVYIEMGDGTGSPTSARLKSDAGTASENWYNGAGFALIWRAWYFLADEELVVQREGVNVPLRFDASSALTTLADTTVWLSAPSAVLQQGDATGNPDELKYKADAGEYDQQWFNVLALRWLARHRTDEGFEMQRRDAAGAFVNDAYFFNASATIAAAATTLADASIYFSYGSVLLQLGDNTGTPIIDSYKDDAGQWAIRLFNESLVRLTQTVTTAENFQLYTTDGGGVTQFVMQVSSTADVCQFGVTPSPTIATGDGTGSPVEQYLKSDAGSVFRDIYSNGVLRFRRTMDASEDVYDQKYTAVPALETELGYLAGGLLRMQTHWAVTDAITAPAALAGYAKFYLDSGLNGRPQLLEADSALEQLGVGITSQAMPVVDRENTDLTVSNTAAETDIFSFSIPANALGANGEFRCVIGGQIHHEGTATIQVRVYLGATTLFDSTTPTLAASADDDAAFRIVVDLVNQNANNDQSGGGYVMISNASNASTGIGNLASTPGGQVSTPIVLGDGAVNTGSAQTFRVSVTWSAAALTNRLVRRYAYATLSSAA